jgi:uncharacterized protein YndB with AHSA1/START domain
MNRDESKKQTVTREVPVSAERLFAVIVDPSRHPEIDGSGTVRSAVTTEHIGKVGDVFSMEMHKDAFGDYQADNLIVELRANQKIAWASAGVGSDPIGHVWAWEFTANGESTIVSHSCDWSGVTDEGLLAVLDFPRVSADQMTATIENLAEAAS